MGQATKRENTIFVADITRFVNTKNQETKVLMDGFRAENAKMAKAGKADRKKFVNKLEDQVSVMRKANVDDLVGARGAWATLSPQGRKAKMVAEQKAKAEQEKKARMEAELRAKALEEMRQKTESEKSKALQESSTEKKKEKK
jgi:colicin import membrane protein